MSHCEIDGVAYEQHALPPGRRVCDGCVGQYDDDALCGRLPACHHRLIWVSVNPPLTPLQQYYAALEQEVG